MDSKSQLKKIEQFEEKFFENDPTTLKVMKLLNKAMSVVFEGKKVAYSQFTTGEKLAKAKAAEMKKVQQFEGILKQFDKTDLKRADGFFAELHHMLPAFKHSLRNQNSIRKQKVSRISRRSDDLIYKANQHIARDSNGPLVPRNAKTYQIQYFSNGKVGVQQKSKFEIANNIQIKLDPVSKNTNFQITKGEDVFFYPAFKVNQSMNTTPIKINTQTIQTDNVAVASTLVMTDLNQNDLQAMFDEMEKIKTQFKQLQKQDRLKGQDIIQFVSQNAGLITNIKELERSVKKLSALKAHSHEKQYMYRTKIKEQTEITTNLFTEIELLYEQADNNQRDKKLWQDIVKGQKQAVTMLWAQLNAFANAYNQEYQAVSAIVSKLINRIELSNQEKNFLKNSLIAFKNSDMPSRYKDVAEEVISLLPRSTQQLVHSVQKSVEKLKEDNKGTNYIRKKLQNCLNLVNVNISPVIVKQVLSQQKPKLKLQQKNINIIIQAIHKIESAKKPMISDDDEYVPMSDQKLLTTTNRQFQSLKQIAEQRKRLQIESNLLEQLVNTYVAKGKVMPPQGNRILNSFKKVVNTFEKKRKRFLTSPRKDQYPIAFTPIKQREEFSDFGEYFSNQLEPYINSTPQRRQKFERILELETHAQNIKRNIQSAQSDQEKEDMINELDFVTDTLELELSQSEEIHPSQLKRMQRDTEKMKKFSAQKRKQLRRQDTPVPYIPTPVPPFQPTPSPPFQPTPNPPINNPTIPSVPRLRTPGGIYKQRRRNIKIDPTIRGKLFTQDRSAIDYVWNDRSKSDMEMLRAFRKAVLQLDLRLVQMQNFMVTTMQEVSLNENAVVDLLDMVSAMSERQIQTRQAVNEMIKLLNSNQTLPNQRLILGTTTPWNQTVIGTPPNPTPQNYTSPQTYRPISITPQNNIPAFNPVQVSPGSRLSDLQLQLLGNTRVQALSRTSGPTINAQTRDALMGIF